MARTLEIGLVNNMPDAALQATERQFRGLIQAAAGDRPVRLRLFHIPGIARSDMAARVLVRGGYQRLDDLPSDGLDALIVTGAEPLTARLQDETYWGAMGELVAWGERNTRSAIWSCLAAHAAVLRLDGIARQRLPVKCSGVFSFSVRSAHALVQGMGRSVLTPHSRANALPTQALTAAGYEILTASPAVGVDAFVREGASRFVFLQGHPEYDADTLRLEYRRDLKRFLNSERELLPEPPYATFDRATEEALDELAEAAEADPRPERFEAYAKVLAVGSGEAAAWRGPWSRFYKNWIDSLTAGRTLLHVSPGVARAAG